MPHDCTATAEAAAPATVGTPTWEEAKAAYLSAIAAYDVVAAKSRAATKEMESRVPRPKSICHPGSIALMSEQEILNRQSLTFDEKAVLVAERRQFLASTEAVELELGIEALEDDDADADEAVSDAREALLNTPAPDMEAAGFKGMVLLGIDTVGHPTDFNADRLSELLSQKGLESWGTARFVLDFLRLTTGQQPEVHAFDPEAWIIEFESKPNRHVSGFGPEHYAREGPAEADPIEVSNFRDLARWQRRMILDVARERDERMREVCAARASTIAHVVEQAGGSLTIKDGELWIGRFFDGREVDALTLAGIEYRLTTHSLDRDRLVQGWSEPAE